MSDLDLKAAKRGPGVIQIAWDPNTGVCNINVAGVTMIEEMGLYTYATHLRLNAMGVGLEKSAIYKPGTPS